MDQGRAPVLDAIDRFHSDGMATYALPGHRLGRGIDADTAAVLGPGTFAGDILMAKQAVPEAEALLAEAVGAEAAIFTTCGSSISIHTAILSLIGPGQRVLVDRNVHKSVVASLILAGAEVVWLRPSWDVERQIAHPAAPADMEAALAADTDIGAVVMITPTEYGTGADVRRCAELCHRRNVPLLVDEAWGAHFPFHDALPSPAIRAGADLVVQSVHKAGGGLCQASMVLLGGDLIDPTLLRQRLDLITTTSPSALIFGSIDGWRRHMVRAGRPLLGEALYRAAQLRDSLGSLAGLRVTGPEILEQRGVAEWDPLKLCVDVTGLGISGYQARQWLRDKERALLQLGDARRVVASLTYADDQAAFDRLGDALTALARAHPEPDRPPPEIPRLEQLNLEQAIPPRAAYFAAHEDVSEPIGRISAEMISPYPPGVPAVLPGERLNQAVVDYLRAGVAAGMAVPDAADPQLKTFRVLR